MGGLPNGSIHDPDVFPNPTNWGEGVEKSPYEIAAKRLEIDHMCQLEANRNQLAGYRMSSSTRGHKSATTDWAHHVGVVKRPDHQCVMTLFYRFWRSALRGRNEHTSFTYVQPLILNSEVKKNQG